MKSRGIETERLRLRPIKRGDLEVMHAIWVDPGVRKFLWDDQIIPPEQASSVIEESITLFENNLCGLWVITPRNEGEPIGFCGYWFFHDPPELELLYGIATESWGKGFATEAARAMIRYGFEELSFDRVQASTDAPNVASVRVMEKAGMVFDKRALTNELDTIYYSIKREDFEQNDHS
ncbi:MAG TPA: GNAT family N-acetyltransferase [Blastocatellia bacterium]|nr:GNAT family N-acetyltransferase [Blastocatellia bacterium]